MRGPSHHSLRYPLSWQRCVPFRQPVRLDGMWVDLSEQLTAGRKRIDRQQFDFALPVVAVRTKRGIQHNACLAAFAHLDPYPCTLLGISHGLLYPSSFSCSSSFRHRRTRRLSRRRNCRLRRSSTRTRNVSSSLSVASTACCCAFLITLCLSRYGEYASPASRSAPPTTDYPAG
jgi:hypothetical protein